MVWLNGEPVNACLLMAYQIQGQTVRTIESVAQDSASEPVRDALARCGGVQCGYCTSGMVMSMSWLHQQQPRPTAAEAEAQMCGNLAAVRAMAVSGVPCRSCFRPGKAHDFSNYSCNLLPTKRLIHF
jgi:aerobic-type carbon monoxide dehydrogenase small subunit (CoxS/CutS family)